MMVSFTIHKIVGGKSYLTSKCCLDSHHQYNKNSPPRQNNKEKKKSKCHGNQKLYHFKRKWRARGLSGEAIQSFIQTRRQQQHVEHHLQHGNQNETNATTEKRKRNRSSQTLIAHSTKSLSQLLLSQRRCKRRREMTETSSSMNDTLSNVGEINLRLDKSSKYLRMPRKLLLCSLRLQVGHQLKKGDEQDYIFRRLQLIDEQLCVDRIWPVSARDDKVTCQWSRLIVCCRHVWWRKCRKIISIWRNNTYKIISRSYMRKCPNTA